MTRTDPTMDGEAIVAAKLRVYLVTWLVATGVLLMLIQSSYTFASGSYFVPMLALVMVLGLLGRSVAFTFITLALIGICQSSDSLEMIGAVANRSGRSLYLWNMAIAGASVAYVAVQLRLITYAKQLKDGSTVNIFRMLTSPPRPTPAGFSPWDELLPLVSFLPLWPLMGSWLIPFNRGPVTLVMAYLQQTTSDSPQASFGFRILAVLAAVWLAAALFLLVRTAWFYLRRREMSLQAATMALNDVFWREHRAEMDKMGRTLDARRRRSKTWK